MCGTVGAPEWRCAPFCTRRSPRRCATAADARTRSGCRTGRYEDRGVAFIMNDRPDLAAELDCDGVHVGEEDMPYAEARRLLVSDRIVGVTCGASRDRAITAAESGAD